MRRKKKSGAGKMIAAVVVVVILLCGIFAIMKNLASPASADNKAGNKEGNSAKATEASTEAPDNSVPMTGLKVTAPATTIRVGQTMQLKISHEPSNATNTKLKWSCSKDGMVTVTKDGVLKPGKNAGKNTVKVTATATDGSKLSASFDLRIYPAIDPSKPMVAITFDDGPNPETTTPMLDALEENYAKATFFCLGQNAGYYPETVQREYNLGMEVGTHTYSHVVLTSLSASALDSEISKSVDAINKAIGVKPSLMRPPYGAVNKTVLSAVGGYNLCCMNWSLDTEDWKTKNADATYNEVMKAQDGDVVLLHDIHEYNVDAVKRFVPDLIAEGFQLVTVPELYEARGETLETGTVHYLTDPTTQAGTGDYEKTYRIHPVLDRHRHGCHAIYHQRLSCHLHHSSLPDPGLQSIYFLLQIAAYKRTSKKPTTVSGHWLSYFKYRVDYALSTFPERRQEVQTYIF